MSVMQELCTSTSGCFSERYLKREEGNKKFRRIEHNHGIEVELVNLPTADVVGAVIGASNEGESSSWKRGKCAQRQCLKGTSF